MSPSLAAVRYDPAVHDPAVTAPPAVQAAATLLLPALGVRPPFHVHGLNGHSADPLAAFTDSALA